MEEDVERVSWVPQLSLSHHYIVAGPSFTGKSTLIFRILENFDKFFLDSDRLSKISVYYVERQPIYGAFTQAMQERHPECSLSFRPVSEFPSSLRQKSGKNGGLELCLFDDATHIFSEGKLGSEMARLTSVARHQGLCLIYLTHKLYYGNVSARLILCNCSYILLIASHRLALEVRTLATQLGFGRHLTDAFSYVCTTDEGEGKASHLLIDLCAGTPEKFRLRARLFDPPMGGTATVLT